MGEDTRELVKKRLDEGLEELGKLGAHDAKRTAKLAEIKTLAETMTKMDEAENERINNNMKNSVEEAKVKNDLLKIEVEQKKVKLTWWQVVIAVGVTFGAETWGFILNENMQPERRLEKLAGRCTEIVQKFRF